jgi:hypothetical protein
MPLKEVSLHKLGDYMKTLRERIEYALPFNYRTEYWINIMAREIKEWLTDERPYPKPNGPTVQELLKELET